MDKNGQHVKGIHPNKAITNTGTKVTKQAFASGASSGETSSPAWVSVLFLLFAQIMDW